MTRSQGTLLHVALAAIPVMLPEFTHLSVGQIGAMTTVVGSIMVALNNFSYTVNPDGSAAPKKEEKQ